MLKKKNLIKVATILLLISSVFTMSCKKSGSKGDGEQPYVPPPAQSGKWRKMTSIKEVYFDFPKIIVIGSDAYILQTNNSDKNELFKYNTATNKITKEVPFAGSTSNIGGIAFEVGGKGYFGFGGFHNVNNGNITYSKQMWRFDANQSKWSQLNDCPITEFTADNSYSANGRAYISGGGAGKLQLYEYNPENDTWTFKANFLSNHGGFTGGVFGIGKNGYMIQNPTEPATFYNGLWEYNLESNSYSKKATPPKPVRISFSSSTKGYALFLNNGRGNDFYEYDPTTDKWSQLTSMDIGAEDTRSAFILQGKAYVISSTYQFGTFDLWEYTF